MYRYDMCVALIEVHLTVNIHMIKSEYIWILYVIKLIILQADLHRNILATLTLPFQISPCDVKLSDDFGIAAARWKPQEANVFGFIRAKVDKAPKK